MSSTASPAAGPWWQQLNRYHWFVVAVATPAMAQVKHIQNANPGGIADAVWAGIVDAYVPSAKMNDLQAALDAERATVADLRAAVAAAHTTTGGDHHQLTGSRTRMRWIE